MKALLSLKGDPAAELSRPIDHPCVSVLADVAVCQVVDRADRRLEVDRGGTEIPAGLMAAIDCTGQAI